MPSPSRESAPLLFGIDLLDFYIGTVEMLERVSEYFSYKEEYVLSKPFAFLKRKYKQFDRYQYEKRRYTQSDMFNALIAYRDAIHNKGKQVEKFLLDDYDDVVNGKQSSGDYKSVQDNRTQSSKLFKQDDFVPFAFMPPEMKDKLKTEKRDKIDLVE